MCCEVALSHYKIDLLLSGMNSSRKAPCPGAMASHPLDPIEQF